MRTSLMQIAREIQAGIRHPTCSCEKACKPILPPEPLPKLKNEHKEIFMRVLGEKKTFRPIWSITGEKYG